MKDTPSIQVKEKLETFKTSKALLAVATTNGGSEYRQTNKRNKF